MVNRRMVESFIVYAMLLFLVSSCWMPYIAETWSVSGTVSFKGTPSHDVTIAAFLVGREDCFGVDSARVSNSVALGTDGGGFSLDMDLTDRTVSSGDRIELILWEDTDGNMEYDVPERFEYTEPLASCPVFKDAVCCLFFYAEEQDNALLAAAGWNIDHGNLISISVNVAVLSNAKITNWYSWN
jgi:hypothetical protein